MSDKPKTIQEALAEVQRRVNEGALEDFGTGLGALANFDPKRSAQYVGRGLRKVGSSIDAARQSVAASLDPEGTKKIMDTPQPGGAEDKLGYSSIVGGEQKTRAGGGTNPPSTSAVPPSPAATGGSPKPATGTGSTGAAAPTPKTSTSTAVEKTPAPTTAAKPSPMSFSQAYAKARELAKAAGKDPNLAQFKWGKDGKTFQAAADKKDYVDTSKQFKVDIGSGSETKPTPPSPTAPTPGTAAKAGLPPSRPKELSGEVKTNPDVKTDVEKNFGQKPDASLNNQSAAAAEVGREAEKRRKQTQENPPVTEEQSLRDAILEVVTREQLAKSGLTLGQYLNKQRGLTAVKGGANDPSSAKFKGPATSTAAGQLNRSETATRALPNTLAGRNQTKDASAASLSDRGIRSYSGGNIDTSKFNAPGGNRAPLPTTSEFKPSTGPVNPKTDVYTDFAAGYFKPPSDSPVVKKDDTPVLGSFNRPSVVKNDDGKSDPNDQFNRSTYQNAIDMRMNMDNARKKPQSLNLNQEETEMNPLIAAFLKLQETKAGNVFEAAKKLTKKQDEKLDVVDDDKIDAKDLAALRAGKKAKMDEEQIDELKKPTPETALKVVNRATDRDEWTPKAANRLYDRYKKGYEPKEKKADVKEGMLDPKDPSVQGGGDVTSSPVKSAKPAAPKKVDGDPSYQGSGEVTKGGKPTSVREAESFLQRFNPFNQLAKSIPTSAEPKKPEQDMRIIVNTPPKKQTPKDGSANSAFPANEEVEHVNELYGKGKLKDIIDARQSKEDQAKKDYNAAERKMMAARSKTGQAEKVKEKLRLRNISKPGDPYYNWAHSTKKLPEEVEQVEEGAVDKAKAFVRLGSKGMTRTDAIASKLSDRTGNWDFKKGGFTGSGKEQVKSRLKNVKGASDYALRNDDVQFSEEEIEFFNSVMEAEPVNKTPVDVSDKSTDKSASKGKIDITDERKYK